MQANREQDCLKFWLSNVLMLSEFAYGSKLIDSFLFDVACKLRGLNFGYMAGNFNGI